MSKHASRPLVFAALAVFIAVVWWPVPWALYALLVGGAVWLARLEQRPWAGLLLDSAFLAVTMRSTGGPASPLDVLVYIWFFGAVKARQHLPRLAFFALLALGLGALGSANWLPYLGIQLLGVASASLVALAYLRERFEGRIDPLTSVLHRRAGLEVLGELVRRGQGFTLAFVDLRGFKTVNDRYGHAVGDEVLYATAQRLRRAVRKEDVVMRYGGDEFIVASQLSALRPRLEATLADPVRTSAGVIRVQADIGTDEWIEGMSLETLLSRADASMYRRKRGERRD